MNSRRPTAFTIVELLASTAVLALLVMLLAAMTNQTAATWRYTTGKIEQFSAARDGFESLTRQLGQATLNTYYDYNDTAGNPRTAQNTDTFIPTTYARQSELRFISGSMDRLNRYGSASFQPLALDPARPRPTHGVFFHAPLGYVENTTTHNGLQSLLNCWGYYVEFNSDERERPTFLENNTQIAPLRWRYRLMEFMQPAEKLVTYKTPASWFATAVNAADTPNAHALAENVIALVLQPALSPKDEEQLSPKPTVAGTALAPTYFYDSTKKNANAAINPQNQLPPNVRVTMVAIDEISAMRMATGQDMPDLGLPGLFRTDTTNSANNYDPDLKSLEETLVARKAGYRIFTTNVVIRGAKWSKQ